MKRAADNTLVGVEEHNPAWVEKHNPMWVGRRNLADLQEGQLAPRLRV